VFENASKPRNDVELFGTEKLMEQMEEAKTFQSSGTLP
jgi:hypothetical protein